MRLKTSTLAALFLGASMTTGAMARYDSGEEDYAEYHPVTSIEAFSNSFHASGESLDLAAEYATANGNVDQAISILRRAMKKEGDDLDIHLALANALEAKIKTQDERDEKMFKECVKEWLTVLRNTVGVEKGISWHGLSLPGIARRYEDTDHGGVARVHLKALVGSEPKDTETDAKYLRRVLNPANTTVSGKVVDSDRDKQQ